jgi:hypothetical protein
MKYIKFIIGILMLVAIAFFVWDYVKTKRNLEKNNAEKSAVTKKIVTEAKEIKRQVDEKGIETVLFDITGNKASIAQTLNSQGTKGIIDTTAMALDIRTKQLKEVMSINSTLSAENLQMKQQLDANKRPFYTYSGNGLQLKFTPPTATDTLAYADFNANVKIKATQYWKRNWFLGAKKSILAVTSDNPMFKINGTDYIEFEQKQPSFGLRIQASGNYNPQTGNIGFGPAVRVDIGRLSVQGNYLYYPDLLPSNRWRPGLTANYDLIRF